jgi:hypothetical protein
MSTTTAPDLVVPLEDASASRQQRLAEAVRSLRTRAGGTDGARLLLTFGGVLVPLGFVLVLLGWYGAAHTANLYEQIPYSISGGMLGLGLIFAGSFCYFAYWLTQLVYAVRRDAADTRAILERIESVLASTAANAAADAPARASLATAEATVDNGAPARRERPLRAGEGAGAATFLATATGTNFHRPDCPAVAGRDGLRHVAAGEEGMTPCRICEPLAERAR